jgi:rhamnosyltransferase
MDNKVSILIRTKNEAKDLPKALELIRQQSFKATEIIVVDSGSTDGTIEIIQRQNDIQLIEMKPEEFTFGRSLNIGCQAAKGDIIVSLSAHAFPCDRDWLKNLAQHFNDPQIAGVYGKQVAQPDAWPPVQRDYLEYYGKQTRFQENPEKFNDHSFSNANSAIRRSCWEKRLFDEILTGGEDREWAKTMLELGFKIVYEPEASVYHSHNEPFLKVYQRTYRESLAKKSIYDTNMTLRSACETWYRSILADRRFILAHNEKRGWLLRSPVYRLFWTLGYLRPHLPKALWEPFVNRWKKMNHLATQKE